MSNFSIPSQPLLTRAALGRDRVDPPGVLEGRVPGLYTSARYAQFALLQALQLVEGDEVLLPSYHCEAMVNPVMATQATPRFYPLNRDLTLNISNIEARMSARTKLIVASHFFGWLQDFRPLRALCDARGVVFLEDCAHALFGQREGVTAGHTGHFAMTSLLKWFPVVDGGALVSNTDAELTIPPTRRPSLGFTLRSGFNVVERAVDFGHWPLLAPLVAFKNRTQGHREVPAPDTPDAAADATAVKPHDVQTQSVSVSGAPPAGLAAAHLGGSIFEPAWTNVAPSTVSQWIFRHIRQSTLAEGRRRVYHALVAALATARTIQCAFRAIGPDEVPYALPVYAHDADSVVARLKAARLPFMRWDRLHPSFQPDECKVASEYAEHLLHIPCLECYGDADIDRWAEALR